MERFKVVEREAKTKAYSKEGLLIRIAGLSSSNLSLLSISALDS